MATGPAQRDRGSDLDAYLRLNAESEAMLSPLDTASLTALLQTAYVAILTPKRDAMLIALDQDAVYESPNFAWFRARYPRFAYVDRIAVSASSRGRGMARTLYGELIARAIEDGYPVLCAEINYEPPNAASDAFHAAMGFEEVGRAHLSDRAKSVRYVVRRLTAD
ncbi:MAG TPA: GNAT family N-acetyltransferase [Candidatus Aquilonibacter sp.]|nr:GNAT family N-acetyltransferase [Candidatus Aquilonibacter sp.]